MHSIQEKAREKAFADWRNRNAVFLVNGRIDLDKPVLLKGKEFYTTFFPTQTAEDEMFLQSYNTAISELIEQEGIPDWAPIKRIPSKDTLLDTLKNHGKDISFLEENFISVKEKRLTQYVLSKWKHGNPIVWVRLKESNLLIIGGDGSPNNFRIDVLDTSEMKWLASLEILLRNYPETPWHNFGNSRG